MCQSHIGYRRGGGGGSLTTSLAMDWCPKSINLFFFIHTAASDVLVKTQAYIQNAILGYHSQHHNNANTPFSVMFCRSDAICCWMCVGSTLVCEWHPCPPHPPPPPHWTWNNSKWTIMIMFQLAYFVHEQNWSKCIALSSSFFNWEFLQICK